MVPTLAVAGFIVLLAFVLGRASAGGGGEAAVQATATAEATTTTTTRDTTHTVAQGESLLAIASRYGLTLDQLAAANGISNANKVFVGQVLKIPTPFPSASTTLPASTTTTTTTKKTTKTP